MKILVLQLARLGDIYQTWPALHALKRVHPQAEIHVLARKKFSSALQGLSVAQKIWELPTKDILEPLVVGQFDVKSSFELLSGFVEDLKAENFNWIINYSFSPFSSYLTHTLATAHGNVRVSGYSRHADGFLSIPDDMSAYFYAQAGVGRSNRFHLAEIFGTLAGVDLTPADWRGPGNISVPAQDVPEILVHIGASEARKALSAHKWVAILSHYFKGSADRVGLVGSPQESEIAETIAASLPADRIVNYVGKTQLAELFGLLKKTKVLLGCDSAPMHMASLSGTPCLNISLASVNFWETGPRSAGSFVIRANTEEDLPSDKVAGILKKMRNNEKQDLGIIPVINDSPSYRALCTREADFQWHFLKAIYMGEDFPQTEDSLFKDGVRKLFDINALMIEQMEKIKSGTELAKVAPIIDRGEEIIETIGKLVPSLAILVRWYQTEKIRLGPEDQNIVLDKSLDIHYLLHKVLHLYLETWQEKQTESQT